MKYNVIDQTEKLDFSQAELLSVNDDGCTLTWQIGGCAEFSDNRRTLTSIPRLQAVFADFSIKSAVHCERFLLAQDNGIRKCPEHILYKSEIAELYEKMLEADEAVELFSLEAAPSKDRLSVTAEVCIKEEFYILKLSCSQLTLEWEEYGSVISSKKQSLREWLTDRAERLSTDIPAVFLALSHKDTPRVAKLLSAAAVAYALSPIDLIPDFIPVIGYLDDLIIAPALIYMALKLIPPEVMAECREKSKGMWKDGIPTKWYYAIPMVIFWVLVILLIISIIK